MQRLLLCLLVALVQGKTPEATASHILVDEEANCLKLKDEINAGADFAEVAKANSKCPSSAKGGSLGKFKKGMMVPEFDKAVFDQSNQLNEVIGCVKTQFGYHLIRVEEREL